MAKLKVGVIFGGRSVEHDVSIVTAHQAMDALIDHEVVPVYVTKEGSWLTSPALHDLEVYKAQTWAAVGRVAHLLPGDGGLYVPASGRFGKAETIPLDVVLPAIHGTNGEDGTLQGALAMAGVPFAGSGVTASAVGMDKVMMKSAFKAAGVPVIDHHLILVDRLLSDPESALDAAERSIGFPAFVKPAGAGSSIGIAAAQDREGLREAVEVARRYGDRILVEPSMHECMEVNCSVLGGAGREPRVSVCEQPAKWEQFLSFEDKYLRSNKGKSTGMAGSDRTIPAPIDDELTKQVQENALKAFSAIGASGVARIDSFVDQESGQTWVMEINTVPGSFSFYLWEVTGMTFRALMNEMLDIALEEHRARKEIVYTFDSEMLSRLGKGKSGG